MTSRVATAAATRQHRIRKKRLEFNCEFLEDYGYLGAIEINPNRAQIGSAAAGVLCHKNFWKNAGGVGFSFLLDVEVDLGCGLDQDQETGVRTQRIATRFAVAPNNERNGEGAAGLSVR